VQTATYLSVSLKKLKEQLITTNVMFKEKDQDKKNSRESFLSLQSCELP